MFGQFKQVLLLSLSPKIDWHTNNCSGTIKANGRQQRKYLPSSPGGYWQERPATYQTRISDFADMDRASGDKLLSAYAELYCRVQRRLFADLAAG